MIVYEREHDFVMVDQHHHALLSGQLAQYWREDLFNGESHREDVIYAIAQHDRAWITLDEIPLWNDRSKAPFSFIDFPSPLKLLHYQRGVDEVEGQNKYAALLCSCHYSSFFYEPMSSDEREYKQLESNRQNRLFSEIKFISDDECSQHLRMLKFLDNLSIYICINEPGISKKEEFKWYTDGFNGSEQLPTAAGNKIIAYWLNDHSIGLTMSPFKEHTRVSVPTKIVTKKSIHQYGVAKAYSHTKTTIRTVEVGPLPI
ncbi:MAG: DUF3891 family protein [Acidibacillus sp.]|uniref:Uncharacterized protein n=1 Tax=Sulfoacidibacillus ferrooxidans TaxID=2005001 RepID=A0A9X1VAI3_9BACL|nr:DUF3891 family protein [Sulfoacidibacillus ferrooxidans]MCI0182407.1 hypothetical protein [Sulfoacidibacillus ferrooxidans]MCY0893626.1 DUF3891 family protein [Acidibacillus sp.]